MLLKKMLLLGAVSATLLFAACDKDDDGDLINELNDTDEAFVSGAARANTAEIQLSQLALDNTINDTIRSYAQAMIDQHQAAQNELDSIAGTVDFDLPHDLDQAHMDLKARLDTMNGYAFDTAFMNSQIADHLANISMYETHTTNGTNGVVKAYAQKYLPAIRNHKALADSVRSLLE